MCGATPEPSSRLCHRFGRAFGGNDSHPSRLPWMIREALTAVREDTDELDELGAPW